MAPRLSFATFGNPNRHQNLMIFCLCESQDHSVLFIVTIFIVYCHCVYIPVFNACWLLSSAYGCARLTLPSQWLAKSFGTDGAKIVFCNLWKSKSIPIFYVCSCLCESQDHSVSFTVTIFIVYCYTVLLYTRV